MQPHTPFADPSTFSLQRHLTETTVGPAEMYALGLVYYPDPDAVDALCEHATGSFCQLVALFAAAQEHRKPRLAVAAGPHERNRAFDRVLRCMVDHARTATETDLLEGMHTARTVFADTCRPYSTVPLRMSQLFAEYAPLGSLTDRVAAEMSVRFTHDLSPALCHKTRRAWKGPRFPAHRADQLVSRLLLSKFGEHVPSWDMFKQVHTPETRVGDVVDLVVAVEQDS